MRQIKASEVKPGMTIRWETDGITHECEVDVAMPSLAAGAVHVNAVGDGYMRIERTTPVTVLSEPQPEEPTKFGAKVMAAGATALRTQDGTDEVDPDEGPWRVRTGRNTWDDMTWAEVCALGPVQVVPNQGWAVPTEAPEVSDQINEWDTWEEVPEGVTVANRKMCYYYRKAGSRVEALSPFNDVVMGGTGLYLKNRPGPWTRVTTNTISHEKKENV